MSKPYSCLKMYFSVFTESNLSESNTEKIQETFSFDFLVTLNTTEECNAVKVISWSVWYITIPMKSFGI